MFCYQCGTEMQDDAKFCSKCGAEAVQKNISDQTLKTLEGKEPCHTIPSEH